MKNIRSKYVKDSLLDYGKLTESLKANTASAVKDLLNEAVRDTYKKILSESEDDYDEEEVDDTNSETDDASNDAQKDKTSKFDKNGNYQSNDDESVEEEDEPSEESTEEVTPDGGIQKTSHGSDGKGNEWSQFEKYKVSDDKYDFSNAEDDEIVKAYKLMKDDDQLIVTKDGDMVHLQDNETGADYIIDLGSVPEEDDATLENDGSDAVEAEYDDDMEDDDFAMEDDDFEFEDDDDESDFDEADQEISNEIDDMEDDVDSDFEDEDEDEFDNDEEDNIMNEQRIFEIALNEYNSNVGYTDNYQKKDVMTNPGMSEPANSKSTNDWDKGVPHGTEKPWSGKKDKYNAPFTAQKGKTVEEEYELECGNMFDEEDEMTIEEKMNVGGAVQQHTTTRSDIPSGRKNYGPTRMKRNVHTSENGQVNGTATASMNESIVKKANAIFEENQQLKKALKAFRNTLNEAAVTNVNLGQIIKLISENTTTTDEKKEIISRFGKEAKTVENSKALYESISNDLKKKNKMSINEEKQFTANSSKMINETQIYKSDDLMESLGMMHRICKW